MKSPTKRLTGADLHRLRVMIRASAADVALRSGLSPGRLLAIERGEAEPLIDELEMIFHVLRSQRRRQVNALNGF